MRALLGLILTFFAVGSVPAQTLRCEAADGRITYVNGTCPPGSRAVKSVDAPPAPSAADRKQAAQRAAADAKTLDAQQKQQRADEERRNKQVAAAEKQEQGLKRECAQFALRIKHAEQNLAHASPKQRDAAQRKRQQMQETYALQCPR
jgi:hypothetical protein